MYAKATIKRDHLAETITDRDWPSEQTRTFEVGTNGPFESDDHGDGPAWTSHRFKLVDDDGITYYSGILKGDEYGIADLENLLFDWGAGFAGTAALFIDDELIIG